MNQNTESLPLGTYAVRGIFGIQTCAYVHASLSNFSL